MSTWNSHKKYDFYNIQISREYFEKIVRETAPRVAFDLAVLPRQFRHFTKKPASFQSEPACFQSQLAVSHIL